MFTLVVIGGVFMETLTLNRTLPSLSLADSGWTLQRRARLWLGQLSRGYGPWQEWQRLSKLAQLRITPALVDYLEKNQSYINPEYKDFFGSDVAAYVVGRSYCDDFCTAEPHFGPVGAPLLDIGGGVGVFSLLYAYFHQGEVVMAEKEVRSGEGELFPLPSLFKGLLEANGLGEKGRFVSPAELASLPKNTFPLVVSFRALGFLFPYRWYRETILASLTLNGKLILDLAKEKSSFTEKQSDSIKGRFQPGELDHQAALSEIEKDLLQSEIIFSTANSARYCFLQESKG
jgi:hypothetical protein